MPLTLMNVVLAGLWSIALTVTIAGPTPRTPSIAASFLTSAR